MLFLNTRKQSDLTVEVDNWTLVIDEDREIVKAWKKGNRVKLTTPIECELMEKYGEVIRLERESHFTPDYSEMFSNDQY